MLTRIRLSRTCFVPTRRFSVPLMILSVLLSSGLLLAQGTPGVAASHLGLRPESALGRLIERIAPQSFLLNRALTPAIAASPAVMFATLTVNDVGDAADINIGDGICDSSAAAGQQCTLRAAIQEANFTAAADTINFNLPGSGVRTVTVATQLPDITRPVTIDGCSQPGATCSGFTSTLLVQLSAASGASFDYGLNFVGSDSSFSQVRGLVINGFIIRSGLRFENSSNNVVQCNFVGTNASGTAAMPNYGGVGFVNSSNNLIGTNGDGVNDANEGNLISGNSNLGLDTSGTGTGNVIAGNRIGTNAAGTAALPNPNAYAGVILRSSNSRIGTNADGVSDALEANLIAGNGNNGIVVEGNGNTIAGNLIGTNATGTAEIRNGGSGIFSNSSNNQIGGVLPAQRNVISGSNTGILFSGAANGNKVQGNYIGTSAAGTSAIPNARGVFIEGSVNAGANLIGTDGNGITDAAEGNLISGNLGFGVELTDSASNNTIAGNRIGAQADGVSPLGNGGNAGIHIQGSSNNTIGGTGVTQGNLIAFNAGNGVVINQDSIGNRVLGNRIWGNGELSIDLEVPAFPLVTPNDPNDPDTGPNNLQNFPVLTAVTATTISGTLDSSTANSAYPVRIELFASASYHADGYGQGEVYLGSTVLAAGPGSFTFNYPPVSGKPIISATATDANGNTSEFSPNTTPTFTPAAAISRQQGSPAGAAVTVGAVLDGQTLADSLVVTQATGGTATGITVSGITNTGGTIAAVVSASCTATSGTVLFLVSDGNRIGGGFLTVNVTANPQPTLSYNNASVNAGTATTVNPATGPTDNVSISTIVVQSVTPSTVPGTITVNNSTGVVSVPNNVPAGSYTVTIRATDNCNATRDASFTLTVNNTAPTITAQTGISRQQGAAASNSQIATVNDAETGANSVTVTVNNGASATVNGVTVSGIANSSGTVTANIVATCGATNASFTLTATDGSNATATATLNVTVTGITVNPATLVNGLTFVSYTATLSATGGTGSYTFSLSSGTLPPGLSLNGNMIVGTPTMAGASVFTIRADDDGNTCFGERTYTVNIGSTGLMYYPLARPVRLLDTRPGASPNACFQPNAPIAGGTSRLQPARGTCEGLVIPANATTITGHATTVQSGTGFLTLYPSDAPQPGVTNSNYLANEILNNAFTVGLGVNDGAFKLFVSATTDIVIDVTGYYAPPAAGGLYFHPLPKPIRLLETRTGFTGCQATGTPLQAATTRTQTGVLTCDGVTIPNGALALAGNATTTNSVSNGYLTLYPADAVQPFASSSNFAAGINRNAPFTVGLSLNGEFKIYTAQTTDLVIDVMGYYSTQATDANGQGLLFNSLGAPLRLMDTRASQPACYQPGTPMVGGTVYTQETQIPCTNLTPTARALVGNVSALNATANGYVTFWPSNATQPTVATSNYQTGRVFNRHFIVGLGPDVAFKRYTLTTTDVIIDISGFFAP